MRIFSPFFATLGKVSENIEVVHTKQLGGTGMFLQKLV